MMIIDINKNICINFYEDLATCDYLVCESQWDIYMAYAT